MFNFRQDKYIINYFGMRLHKINFIWCGQCIVFYTWPELFLLLI